MYHKAKQLSFILIFLGGGFLWSNNSCTWDRYAKEQKSQAQPILPDYSYAGYQYGTQAIPKVEWKTFDVTQFGALPNDDQSDFEGIQKTIAAAEKHGSGVVFFPPGRFLVGERDDRHVGINIHGPNIVLRGSGSGLGGTELHQRNSYHPTDLTRIWTVPAIFNFKSLHPLGNVHLARNRKSATVLALVTADAPRESFTIEVDQPQSFAVGQTIMICMQNLKANDSFLKGLQVRDIFTEIHKNGVSVSEKHTIAAINGSQISLQEPLHTPIFAEWNWTIYDYPVVEGWGVEDISFSGNCPAPFVHHKNYTHDGGFVGVNMAQCKNSWIRRCRFSNMSGGFSASGAMASSFILNTIDGQQGHGSFGVNWGYGSLIGLSQDLTDKGTFHGPSTSHEQVGAVIWRYESMGKTKSSARCGGPDFHAQFPYCTLWDHCTANLSNNGGNYSLQPNHLRDLTYWNFQQVGTARHLDFWDMPVTDSQRKQKYFGAGPWVVFPNVIGFHGVMSTFNQDHIGIFESYGQPVEPSSLYEAQLSLRLGKVPSWIIEAQKEWEQLKIAHRHAGISLPQPN